MVYKSFCSLLIAGLLPLIGLSQGTSANSDNWATSPGVIGTFALLVIVLMVTVFILVIKMNNYIDRLKEKKTDKKGWPSMKS